MTGRKGMTSCKDMNGSGVPREVDTHVWSGGAGTVSPKRMTTYGQAHARI